MAARKNFLPHAFASETLAALSSHRRMPQYFVSVENGEPVADPVAEELSDDDAARHLAGQIANDLSRNSAGGTKWHVRLRDQNGVVVADVPFNWDKPP
jgi:hypothetical protein